MVWRFLERVVVPLVLVAIIVWQHTASTSSGTSAADPSPSATGHLAMKGVAVLPPARLGQPLVLSRAGIREMPPPPGARPRISARRALSLANARHARGAQSVQPVLVLFTDPSVHMSSVLAWDIREVGCFHPAGASPAHSRPTRHPSAAPASSQPVPACMEHQLVIVTATTGRVSETIDY